MHGARMPMIVVAAVAAALFVAAGIAVVSAATFDSDLVPATGATFQLGTAAGDWRAINNTIFFSGSNVGIGASSFTPTTRLHVQGNVRVQNGNVYFESSSYGPVLKDNMGGCWRVAVDSGGALSAVTATCSS